jgi:hypothetical protein
MSKNVVEPGANVDNMAETRCMLSEAKGANAYARAHTATHTYTRTHAQAHARTRTQNYVIFIAFPWEKHFCELPLILPFTTLPSFSYRVCFILFLHLHFLFYCIAEVVLSS